MCGVLLMLFGSQVAGDPGTMPPALLLFEQARARIAAEFAVRTYTPDRPLQLIKGIVAPEGVLIHHLADSDGSNGQTEDGRPVFGMDASYFRLADGQRWSKAKSGVTASVIFGDPREMDGAVPDIRTIGMLASGVLYDSSGHMPVRLLGSDGRAKPPTYLVREGADGQTIVEASWPEHRQQRVVWHLDPRQGWNATRVEEWVDGKLALSVENEYQAAGDYWLPVRSVRMSGADERVTAVTELTFGRVGDRTLGDALVPAAIGIVNGTPVSVEGKEQHFYFDGALIAQTEYRERKKAGETFVVDPRWRQKTDGYDGKPGETRPDLAPAELRDAAPPRPSELAKTAAVVALRASTQPALDPWEAYVVQFIERYRLDRDQSQKAHAILRECTTQRDEYLGRRAGRIRELTDKRPATAGDRGLVEEELRRLLAPVDRMFEQLKQRLDRLPTRAQRDNDRR
ncbi:MAG TPA: hypothetical protein PKC49_02635 [Phycisphaerae bacterium]|nr:hypothetical protein [Phycisphaerae bacterium]